MPNRIIKESICTSESIDKLSPFEEIFFYRLLVTVDDFGRMDARPKILASRLFPLRDVRNKQIEDALRALTLAELIDLYTVGERSFLQVMSWDRHQTPRAKTSKYPSPDEKNACKHMNASASMCKQMQADAPDIRYSNSIFDIRESKENAPAPTREAPFTPPSVDEVRKYCEERKNGIDAARFVDFYSSKGWMIGKNRVKDWRACVRTWEAREQKPTDGGEKKKGSFDTDEFFKLALQKSYGKSKGE
jgi:hypothetical protein